MDFGRVLPEQFVQTYAERNTNGLISGSPFLLLPLEHLGKP